MKGFANTIRRQLSLLVCLSLLLGCICTAGAAAAPEEVYNRPLAGGVSQVAMSGSHIAVLRSDGTVAAAGSNDWKQCEVSGWSRIVKIWVCQDATLGLTQEGTVLSTCTELPTWQGIVDVAVYRCASPDIVVMAGLKADGTVVRFAAGKTGPYPLAPNACNVSGWKDVVQLSAWDGIYALTAEGTVLEAQPVTNLLRTSPVAHWKDIRELVCSEAGLFGISNSGAVFTAEPGSSCENWKDVSRLFPGSNGALYALDQNGAILSGGSAELSILGVTGMQTVAGSPRQVVGLLEDGSIRFWPEPSGMPRAQRDRWTDAEDLFFSPGGSEVAVLRYDGTVVAARIDDLSKEASCNGWTDIARLFCCGQRWLGLKEDGSLVANFKIDGLEDLTAGVKNTRPQEQPRGLMAAGIYHSVYLRGDGRVSGAGLMDDGRLRVEGWKDITAVSAYDHTVGLRSDGTVIAVGNNVHGQCNVSTWTDVVDIDAGGMNTVGLTSRGTVLVTGSDVYDQHNLTGCKGVTMVEAGGSTVYALTGKGTVVAAGSNADGQANVSGWSNVVAISAGTSHVVALLSDGTVVAAGNNAHGQCNVSSWRDIVAISAGGTHTVGLRANGSMVFAGSNEFGQGNLKGWKNVIAISTGLYHTLGITGTGTILSTGSNEYGQCDVGH